jgi:thiol-disulfide isomerase/thioredoxin
VSTTHPTHSDLSALDRAPVWLHSEPLTAEELRGRVVIVDIWTYSCVNWLRTLPYVRAWAERYHDRGLVVVGAHCPEFGFEHDLDNVRHATRQLGIDEETVRVEADGLAEAADWDTLGTGETYDRPGFVPRR